MDFIDKLQALASRIEKQKDRINTEEATKQAFILPSIQLLGYDIWNPDEVIPEFIADVGIKKGKKIDYVICQDGKPIILVEAKKAGGPLDLNHSGQLFRYSQIHEADPSDIRGAVQKPERRICEVLRQAGIRWRLYPKHQGTVHRIDPPRLSSVRE